MKGQQDGYDDIVSHANPSRSFLGDEPGTFDSMLKPFSPSSSWYVFQFTKNFSTFLNFSFQTLVLRSHFCPLALTCSPHWSDVISECTLCHLWQNYKDLSGFDCHLVFGNILLGASCPSLLSIGFP